jgi:hypothetical protein
MQSLIQFKRTALLLLIPFALGLLGFSSRVQAVSPSPDGCYPNFTTAEGCNALNVLSTGEANTGLGWRALFSDTTGNFNTAVGAGALVLNTGEDNTAVGAAAGLLNTTGLGNVAVGAGALVDNDSGSFNTAIGSAALNLNTTANDNTAVGSGALAVNAIGTGNTGIGRQALLSTTGNGNTALGAFALQNVETGGDNIALGNAAGQGLITGDNNIYIGSNVSSSTESNNIRIGTQGTQMATFIAGISGATISGTAVVVNSFGQLGVAPSSKRFKDEIKPMDKTSEAILALKPVTFRYKKEIDSNGVPQFGLVAEEVAKVNPDLVVRDEDGKVYTVRYDAVNAMLLNEFLKEHKKVEGLEATVAKQEAAIEKQQKDFQATTIHQQKQIEALAAGLQKVSAQLELNKSAPRTVNNP